MAKPSKSQVLLRVTARRLAAATVLIAPWLFGAAEPWAYLLMCELAGLATVFWLFSVACSRDARFVLPGLTTALLVLTLYVLLQSASLPPDLVRSVNPFAAEVRTETRATLSDLSGHALTSVARTAAAPADALSLAPAATRRSLYLWVAYLGVFLVLANTLRRWEDTRRLCGLLALGGFVMAILALAHKFSGSDDIFWFHEPQYGGNVFGPFSNRNHYAAYMNMLLGVALGLFLSSRHLREKVVWPDWRDRLAWLSTRRASRIALAAFAVLVFGGSVCATMSRGAILSLSVALVIVAALVFRHTQSLPRARSGIMSAVMLALAAVAWLGRTQVMERMASLSKVIENPLDDYRTIVTAGALRLFAESPIVGTGFGSFRHVFSIVQRPELQFRWLHAHNDWVQLLTEGGIAGALLFGWVLLLWVAAIRERFSRSTNRAQLLVIGLLCGLFTITIHSVFDYSLHKPANAFLLVAMAGMAGAAIHLRIPGQAKAPPPRARHRPVAWFVHHRVAPLTRVRITRAVALAMLAGVTVLLFLEHRELRAELALSRFLYLRDLAEKVEGSESYPNVVENACAEGALFASYRPGNPDGLMEVSSAVMGWQRDRNLDRIFRASLAERSMYSCGLAVGSAPSDYLSWLWLARLSMVVGAWDDAEVCLDRARGLVLHPEQVRMFERPPREALPDEHLDTLHRRL